MDIQTASIHVNHKQRRKVCNAVKYDNLALNHNMA